MLLSQHHLMNVADLPFVYKYMAQHIWRDVHTFAPLWLSGNSTLLVWTGVLSCGLGKKSISVDGVASLYTDQAIRHLL